jgi:hypothetical protein
VTPLPSGLDTTSFAFRGLSSKVVDAFMAKPHRSSAGGSLVTDERGEDGGRLLYWPGHDVMAYESRLGALLAGSGANHELVRAERVPTGAVSARAMASELIGADPGARVEVRRFDLAVELRFENAAEGHVFLRTLGGMCPARHRVTHERDAAGLLMTVYHRTERAGVVKLRAYDKGRESGSDPPGRRVRIERQNRPPKSARFSPDVFAKLDLRGTFASTMSHYLKAEKVVAAGVDGAVSQLVAKAVRGEISPAKAERLAGSIAFLRYGGRAVYDRPGDARKTNLKRSSARLAKLRQAGIALEDELPAESVVPVSELVRQAVEEFRA